MKKRFLVFSFLVFLFFSSAAFSAVSGISIDRPNLGLEVGQTGTLIATVTADPGDDKTFTWASDSSAATINQNGQVTAFNIGGAVITATTNTGGYVASCYVSVSAPTIPVRGISLDKTSLILGVGEKYTLIPSFSPSDATGKHVTWTSSNDSVAAVDITGKISAVSPGAATITVTTVDGGFTEYCDVEVRTAVVPVTGVTLDKTALSLTVGQTSQLNATVAPSDATGKHVTWTSSNDSVAAVDITGIISAVSPGDARITVTTVDGGFTAYCDVEVRSAVVPVTGVSLDKTALSLTVGQTSQLNATVAPSDATGKHVTWTSSNDSVAVVDITGIISAVSPGDARITVTTVDGGFTAYCDVEVRVAPAPVTGVTLDNPSLSILVGQSRRLGATVWPVYATNKNVTWTSSNVSVASVDNVSPSAISIQNAVDSTAEILGVSPGNATITARTVDGGFLAQCEVTVSRDTGGATEGCNAVASPDRITGMILFFVPFLLLLKK